jgi:hypothetical protein
VSDIPESAGWQKNKKENRENRKGSEEVSIWSH